MANSETPGGPMRDLREKTEALRIPLRPLPREVSKGHAEVDWEQALLWKPWSRSTSQGQESRKEVSQSISDALELQRLGNVAAESCLQLLLRWHNW